MSDFDHDQYLSRCARSKLISMEELAFWGVVGVLCLTALDLFLTMAKISEGSFMDANPIAQMFIDNGIEWGIIVFKVLAATFFAHVCLKNLHLLTTQIGVGLVALAHVLLTFHWTLLI